MFAFVLTRSLLFYLLLIFFSKSTFSKNFFRIIISVKTVCIQIRPDILSGLIWVQTVFKNCEQTTLVGKELTPFPPFKTKSTFSSAEVLW